MHLDKYFLGKQRLIEEENEDDLFSNDVVTDYSASCLSSNGLTIGDSVRLTKLAII